MAIEKTPLDSWILKKISGNNSGILTKQLIADYQLAQVQKTLAYVMARSRFYQRHLDGVDWRVSDLRDLARLPLTTAGDLGNFAQDMVCVGQNDIHRIVTLQTSGTTGQPKRVFFTEEDQELTLDFFHHGMLTMVKPGDRVLILLPGRAPGSVGDLLNRGLARAGVQGIIHGPVSDPEVAWEQMIRERITGIVGIPTQVLALAKLSQSPFNPQLRSVLLTTDHVPEAIVRQVSEVWGCQVFNHYGMTEMGLGGGVDCQGFSGYHLREADLYVEIIDPATGDLVPEGQWGEVVFTTLTRTGMPLIRYRTGDFSRFLPGPCPCGSLLRRMERVRSRDRVKLEEGEPLALLTMADLDEALFGLSEVLNFSATLAKGGQAGETLLTLRIALAGALPAEERNRYNQVLEDVPAIKRALARGNLKLEVEFNAQGSFSGGNGTGKRTILDQRG